MAGTRAGRSQGQDSSHPVEGRLARRREVFFNNLVDASSSGRWRDQDSLPPTIRAQTDGIENPFELVTLEGFFKTRRASEGTIRATPSLTLSPDGDRRKSPTALEKIVGIVRRGSLSLGLGFKASVPLGKYLGSSIGPPSWQVSDLASVSYVAEHQENLRAVQIMLHIDGSPSKHDLRLETGAPQGDAELHEVILVSKESASSLRISLPTAVYPAQCVSLTSHDLHLEAKLSALPSATSSAGSSTHSIVNHALSAAELRHLQPKALCCGACDRTVAVLSASTVYKDLPSEHWAEMMEVWMCHADPKFTARIAQQTRDGFWPNESTVLVGGSYLLVDSQQAKKHDIVHSGTEVGVVLCSVSLFPRAYKKVFADHQLAVPQAEAVGNAIASDEALASLVCS